MPAGHVARHVQRPRLSFNVADEALAFGIDLVRWARIHPFHCGPDVCADIDGRLENDLLTARVVDEL